ncbi:MAG: hypothetical protein ACTSVO_08315 [Candidatus Heimdallarchaeaceae archaeon]
MESNKIVIFNAKESTLISSLLDGAIEASDFRLLIGYFSKTKVTNLFRDSFPKFSSRVKSKITDTFNRCFFSNNEIDINEFWQFVDFRGFWPELRKFHNIIYSRDMTLSDVIKFFEQTLFHTKSSLNLNFLQKKIIKKLGRNPSSLYKQLAEDLGISEKKVSVTLKHLNSHSIYLGSLISYKSLNLHEFFSFNRSNDFGDNAILIDRYLLFPDLNITHGIMSRKKHGPSFYYVKDKKMYFNPDILNKGLSIRDWKKHSSIKQKNFSDFIINTESKTVSLEKHPYLPHLLRNCELDFKRPDIKTIAESHDVSARTLFRIKSKLIEDNIIQPNIIVETPDLLQVLIVSKFELADLYNKVPFIRTYQIHDDFGDISWLSYLSIFMLDFKYIYSRLSRNSEVFQVIKRQVKDLNIDVDFPIPLHSNRKTYTNK